MMETDIFEQIREDHRMVGDLIDELLDQDGGDARMGANDIGGMLLPHAMAEEATLYPAVQANEKARKHIDEAIEEHRKIEQYLNDFAATPQGDSKEFTSRLKKLQGEIEHHVKGEEGKTFDLAQDLLSDQQIMDLSRRFPAEKDRFRGEWRLAA